MKKILLMVSSLALAVVAFNCVKPSSRVSAEVHEELATTLLKYRDSNGNYTKKSKIYFNSAVMDKAKDYLHAQTVDLERTTYYDEDYNGGGALLMGDYDGTFTRIKSGYATNAAGKLEHYRPTDTSSLGENLFSGNVDYTLNTTCNEFFDVLSGLAAEVTEQGASAWTLEDGIYTHTVPASLTLDEHGNYNDILLKRFQYFGAPMLLQGAGAGASHYLTFSSIKVEEKVGYLSIRLYLDEVDSGKVTGEVENGEVLLSEAQVYEGFDVWFTLVNGKGVDMERLTPGSDKAVFKHILNAGDKLVVKEGFTPVPLWNEGTDTEFTASANGAHTIYVNSSTRLYPNAAQYGGTINGKAIEVNDVQTEGDNKAVFHLSLKSGDILTLNEGTSGLKFVHYSGGVQDDGYTYTANADQTLWFYYTNDGVYISVEITFTLLNYDTHGGTMYIAGINGSWDWVAMSWSKGDNWSKTFVLSLFSTQSFKFVTYENKENKWEDDPNRTLTVSSNTASDLTFQWNVK